MRIVVLGLRGFPDVQGGVEKHCEELYPRLVKLGCEVIVLTRAPYTGKKEYEYQGVRMVPVNCPASKYLEAIIHTFLGIFKARSLNPDLVHIHAIGPALMIPLARLLGLKVILTHHGPDYMRQKWSDLAKWVLRLGERFGANLSQRVIVISNGIRLLLLRKHKTQSVLIPNGVVIMPPSADLDLLARFQLTERRYVLAVGRFVPEKGFQDLLEAFADWQEQGSATDWKLVLVGDADHEDAFSRRLKARAQAIPAVVLAGFQNKAALVQLYTHAGLFVLPSYHEGLPISLLEALSYGLDCLVSDIEPNREVTLEPERYFKTGDVDDLTEKLQTRTGQLSVSDVAARQKRIEHIRITYNWDRIAQQTLGVYRAVVGAQPKNEARE